MTPLDIFLLLTLIVGAVASLGFFLIYGKNANLRSPTVRQILALNITIALMLILSVAHGLRVLPEEIILLLQGMLLVVADGALIYQFVMLKNARRSRDLDR